MPDSIIELASRIRAEFQLLRLQREGRSVRLEDFVPDNETVQLTSIAEGPWNMRLFEIAALCLLARKARAKMVLEIGTFDGRTTVNLGRALGEDAHVTTINLPVEVYPEGSELRMRGVGYRFASQPEASRIEQLYADSATVDPEVLGRRFDLVFIDGAHTEKYVRSDTTLALRVLVNKPEALIVWDDMQYHGVQRAVRAMERSAGFRFYHLAHTKLAFAFPFASGGALTVLSPIARPT